MSDRVDLDEGTRLRAAVARGVCSIIEADALEAWTVNNFPAHRDETLALREQVAMLRRLVADMTDPGACWFDHHGGCQEHGYLDLKPGELCPHAEAKTLLEGLPE